MNTLIETLKKYWWVIALVVFVLLIVSRLGGSKPETKFDVDAIQKQIENEPKLKENIESPRNNFKGGSYNLKVDASSMTVQFDKKTMTVPVKSGTMTVLENGRIKNFRVDADFSSGSGSDVSFIKKALGINGVSPVTIQGLTILPNTVDSAFTVAFAMNALGKDTSFATGISVDKEGASIKISGPINLDKSLLGLSGNMVITPNFVFE